MCRTPNFFYEGYFSELGNGVQHTKKVNSYTKNITK